MRYRILHSLMLGIACLLIWTTPLRGTGVTPNPAELPVAYAPFRLADVPWPSDRQGVLDLFAALPSELAGEAGQPIEQESDRIVASYGLPDPMVGNPLRLSALHFSDGDFFPPDFTAGQFVSMACATEDMEAVGCGREDGLVWLATETTVGTAGEKPGTPISSHVLFTLSWGMAESAWLYGAAATSPQGLEALVTAVVAAAGVQEVTPVWTIVRA